VEGLPSASESLRLLITVSRASLQNVSFLRKGFWKLTSGRQTDRHD